MKIIVEEPEDMYEGTLKVSLYTLEGKKTIRIGSGESEDMNLARDLSDALIIPKVLEMAYNAGKNGEDLEIKNIQEEN